MVNDPDHFPKRPKLTEENQRFWRAESMKPARESGLPHGGLHLPMLQKMLKLPNFNR